MSKQNITYTMSVVDHETVNELAAELVKSAALELIKSDYAKEIARWTKQNEVERKEVKRLRQYHYRHMRAIEKFLEIMVKRSK